MSAHIGITGPDGEPLGGWTTTEDGEHIPDDSERLLTFADLSAVNLRRASRWHPSFHGSGPNDWNGGDWSNAMMGEAGEAANVVKKLRRKECSLAAANDPDTPTLIERLGDEIADMIIYADLLAAYYHVDIPAAIVRKFNAVSEREGFPERLD